VEGRQLHWSGVHRCGAWWVALGQGSRTNTAVPIVYGRNSTYNITFLVRRIVLGCTHCSDIFFSIRRRIRTIYTTANTERPFSWLEQLLAKAELYAKAILQLCAGR
jgi:hypothetical protein